MLYLRGNFPDDKSEGIISWRTTTIIVQQDFRYCFELLCQALVVFNAACKPSDKQFFTFVKAMLMGVDTLSTTGEKFYGSLNWIASVGDCSAGFFYFLCSTTKTVFLLLLLTFLWRGNSVWDWVIHQTVFFSFEIKFERNIEIPYALLLIIRNSVLVIAVVVSDYMLAQAVYKFQRIRVFYQERIKFKSNNFHIIWTISRNQG